MRSNSSGSEKITQNEISCVTAACFYSKPMVCEGHTRSTAVSVFEHFLTEVSSDSQNTQTVTDLGCFC